MRKIFIGVIVVIIVLVGLALTAFFEHGDKEPLPDIQTLPPADGLPDNVEAKRQAIFRAVTNRSYADLAKEAELNLSYSFGGEVEGGFRAHLEAIDSRSDDGEIFDIISTLLVLPHTKIGDIYVWPSVFAKTSDEWTDADIELMRTFLTDEEIESYKIFGGYAYYRLGITEDGGWTFFIAGD